MPKILINELDNTTPGTPGSYANYAVLIAGYQKEFSAAEITTADTKITAYNQAVAAAKTDSTVTIPELSADEKMIKARAEKMDTNGVYEFSSWQDFANTIGYLEDVKKDVTYEVETKDSFGNVIDTVSFENTEFHYGNKMACELLKLGYTIIYRPISTIFDMKNADFWGIFKDKASYDFRFVSHGMLNTNHDASEFEALKDRLDEIKADIVKFAELRKTVEDSKDFATKTIEQQTEAYTAEYNRVIDSYAGFMNSTGKQRYSYSEAYAALYPNADGEIAALVAQEALIEYHNNTCVTPDVFDAINGNIASLASYSDKTDESNRGRGDCTALIELREDKYVSTVATGKPEVLIIEGINEMPANVCDNGAYCALTVPSVYYKSAGKMPGAFHYLACFMNSLKSGFAEWYAAAGYTRGVSSYVIDHTSVKLGEIAINALEPRNIINQEAQPQFACNVIANFRGSYYLWGNRTAHKLGSAAGGNDLVAWHFLNIRQLCSTIKKQLYVACRRFTFDPNSDTLWFNFVNAITPTLDAMKADQGVRDYKILKVYTDKKATLKAKIRIIPIEAVEDFDIEVSLEDSFGETSVATN